jgi:hypothetical protein
MRLAVLAVLALLGACSSQSADDVAAREVDAFTSWAATAHLVADRWLADAVPDHFASQTLRLLDQTLRKELRKNASGTLPEDVRSRLNATASAIDSAAVAMRTAIERRDRTTVAEQIGRLSAARRALTELTKRGGTS